CITSALLLGRTGPLPSLSLRESPARRRILPPVSRRARARRHRQRQRPRAAAGRVLRASVGAGAWAAAAAHDVRAALPSLHRARGRRTQAGRAARRVLVLIDRDDLRRGPPGPSSRGAGLITHAAPLRHATAARPAVPRG